MKCSMIGLGRLGLPVSCAMIQKGHEVYGYDIDPQKMMHYRSGHAELHEPNIDRVLKEALASGLHIVSTMKEAVEPAEIVFIAVPTPSRSDWSFNTDIVKEALYEIVDVMSNCLDYKVVAIISTVLPGTVRKEFLPILVERLGEPGPQSYGLCYNAQFIAMGTVIEDMLNPEFVLIGEYDDLSGNALGSFYSQLVDVPLLRMTIENAEMVKMCYNTMIGFKIVYANTIMELCHHIPHADCDVISDAIGKANQRLLSPRYLRGGMGDGGGCLPPGEIVITQDGPKAIEKVRPGENVLTVDGTLQSVLGRWERDYDGGLFHANTRGLPGAKLTADHLMIVAKDGRTRYNSGQRDTRYPIVEKMGEKKGILAEHLSNNFLVPFPIPLDQIKFAWDTHEHVCSSYIELAGWYLSEGCATCSNRRGRVGFALHENEIRIAHRLGELCVRLDPPPNFGRRKDVKVSISQKEKSKGIMIRYGSKYLAQHLIEDFGTGAVNKRIPDWIVYGPIEWAKLLMRGLWQGDGHTCEQGMSLSTISRHLAWSTFLILSRLDVPATLRDIPPRIGKDGQKHKRAYEVRVRNKKHIATMAEITGLEDKTKEQPKLYDLYPSRDNAFWRHVSGLSCEPYKGKVYNLWVEGNNTYVTGCGAVHNCHPRDNRALSWLAQQKSLNADPFDFVMRARELQSMFLAGLVSHWAARVRLPVAVMGLTFKPETNLTEDSPSLLLIKQLEYNYGLEIERHDPIIGPDLLNTPGPYVYVIATAHKQYKTYPFVSGSVIIDPWRFIPDIEGCRMVRVGGDTERIENETSLRLWKPAN